jgi:hypothetical protein
MKKIYSILTRALVFSLIMAMPLAFYAQDGGENTKKEKKSSSFSPYLFLQGDLGPTWFHGDLARYGAMPDIDNTRTNGTVGLGYQYLPWFKIYGT